MHVFRTDFSAASRRYGTGLLLLLTTACGVQAPKPTATAPTPAPPAPTPTTAAAAKAARTAVIGCYNVENLFDTKDDPNASGDEEFTPTGFRQWDDLRYHTKLRNLASVIAEIGTDGPDIMGINEAENRNVLRDLVAEPALLKSRYEIVHFDSPDSRGIDVALLYKPDRFQMRSQRAVKIPLPDTTMGTRDLLLVEGLLNGEAITFLVAHWPSRVRGEKAIKRRYDVARQNRVVIDEILKGNPEARILLMGDLNDTPGDSSVASILRSSDVPRNLTKGTLYNPFWELQLQGKGTMYYRSRPDVFDQMLVSPALAGTTGFRYVPGSATIFKPERITSPQARWPGEPLRTFSGRKYIGGYSDHFPVFLTLTK